MLTGLSQAASGVTNSVRAKGGKNVPSDGTHSLRRAEPAGARTAGPWPWDLGYVVEDRL